MSENLENRISSEQAKDAIFKMHSVQSSASEIDDAVNKLSQTPLKINNYLIIGASIMAQSFTEHLTKQLIDSVYRVNCNFHNRAVGGWKTSNLKANIDSILADYSYDDMLVFIHIGGNDVSANRNYFSTDINYINNMKSDLEYIINAVINKGYIPVLSELTFRNYNRDNYLNDDIKGSFNYNKYLYRPLIKKYSPLFSFDNSDSFMQLYTFLFNNLDYISDDTVHPSILGREKIRNHFVHTICYYNYFGIKPDKLIKKNYIPLANNDTKSGLFHLAFNNINKYSAPYVNGLSINSTIENLKDSSLSSSSISVSTSGFVASNGIAFTEVFNDSGFLLDHQFSKNTYIKPSDVGKILISNLDNLKKYTLRLSALRIVNELRETNIEIQGVSKSYITSNVDKMSGVVFENLIPENGIIEIIVTVKTGSYGYVSGLDIIEN